MKCTLCNERNGSTRCEGCQQLYCLPCMNKHHDELAQQFQSLTDARNELKQSINATESTSENNKEVPCIAEIDHWEQEIIQRIRNIAAKSRTTVNEIIAKNIAELQHRFEQISADIQQRQKDGNYLENDIDAIKTQLEQLRNDIEHVPKTIHVDSTVSTNTEWNTLIYVVEEDLPSKTTTKLAQTNDQSTKERKNKSYWNHLVELSEVTNSSPITTPNEQAAIGKHICHMLVYCKFC
jgi:cell division protein FtsB